MTDREREIRERVEKLVTVRWSQEQLANHADSKGRVRYCGNQMCCWGPAGKIVTVKP